MRPPPEAERTLAATGGGPALSLPELFGSYLDDYFAAMARLSWADLVRRRQGLHASLAYGAAGITYAHWYAGHLRGDEILLEQAERWSRAALAGQRHRFAFLSSRAPRGAAPMPAGSYVYGRSGLYAVRALVAHSRGDRPAGRQALDRFAELSRAGADGDVELYKGSAGALTATAILYRHLGDARLLDLGAELSAALCRRAVVDGQGTAAWDGLQSPGLAHGTAGVLLALLLWSAAAGSDLPPWLSPSLHALLDTAVRSPERFAQLEADRSRLCSGLTGPAYLAARAARILGDPSLLAAARATAWLATAHPPGHADLCCGRAGCAFALLPLAEQDPGGPWRERALSFALSTLLCDRADWALTGLYGGEAGIPCLALNMMLGIDSGPPGLDFIPLPRR